LEIPVYEIIRLSTPVVVGIIGYLIVRNTRSIERDIDRNYTNIKEHDGRLADHEVRISILELERKE
jgi:hypothetical protein